MSVHSDHSSDPVIHLMLGSTGAGKSTYANLLKTRISAVNFAVDDWMMSLFAPDLENPLDWNWISERAMRCEDQILSLAIALADTGTSSILEIGLQRTDKRSAIVSTMEKSDCSFQTHFLNIDATERWRRVQQRNTAKDETFRLTVTRDMFDFFEQIWQPPSDKELISMRTGELISEYRS